MKYLKVRFEALDGYYNLVILDDHSYNIETSIACLDSKDGIIDNYDKFVDKLNEVNIKSWGKEYLSDLGIEYGVKWSVEIDSYMVRGFEGNWPYTYDKLIDTLKLIDEKIGYFKANLS